MSEPHVGRAPFPDVRHRLRSPRDGDDSNTAVGPAGDDQPEIFKPGTRISKAKKKLNQEDGVIRKVCLQFENVDVNTSQYPSQLGYLLDKVIGPKDVDEVANGMYELGQLGPKQAQIAGRALAFLLELEVDGYKLKPKLLKRMLVEFEGFEKKAKSSPQAVLCSAILLGIFHTRRLLRGEPVAVLKNLVWKYFTYMLESRKELFMKHCFQLVKNGIELFAENNRTDLEAFLLKLKDLVLDEKQPKETRYAAFDTLDLVCQEIARQKKKRSKGATATKLPVTVKVAHCF